jgi:hypothetical protein
MSYYQYGITDIIEIERPDNTTFTSISFNVFFEDWIITINMNQTNFLELLLDDSELGIIIKSKDFNIIYNNGKYNRNNLNTLIVDNFILTHWFIEYSDNLEYNSNVNIIIILFIVLYLIIVSVIVLSTFIIKYTNDIRYQKHIKESNKKLEISNKSIHYILHEIKNILSVPFTLFGFKTKLHEFEQDELNSISNSIKRSIDLSSNILDFEELIMDKYKKKKNKVFLYNTILNIIKLPFNFTIKTNNNTKKIIIDRMKLTEVITNLVINACNNVVGNNIDISYEYLDDNYLLFKISNKAVVESIDNFEDLFIPNFLDKNVIDRSKFELNKDIYNKYVNVKNNNNNLLNYYEINENIEFNSHYEKIKSNGMGLSISRLICKNLGGDIGIEYDNETNIFTTWFIVKYEDVIEDEIYEEEEKESRRSDRPGFELRLDMF